MRKLSKYAKVRYYQDEIVDDFGAELKKEELGNKFKYNRSKFYSFISYVFTYCFAVPITRIIAFFIGIKVENKKKLKELKKSKQGYFIYANHEGVFDVICNLYVGGRKRVNTVGHSGAFAIKACRPFLRLLGYMPLPNSPRYLIQFQDKLESLVRDDKEIVAIFPESTLWPYYTKVRHFKYASFRYPARAKAPVVPVFYARRERKGFWKLFKRPRLSVIIGDPIYPKEELSERENIRYLGETCFNSLQNLSESINQEIYVNYIKKDLNDIKLTVLVVCDVYGEENNGTMIAATNLIKYLREQGHKVRILCCDQNQIGKEDFYVAPVRSFGIFNNYVAKNGVQLAKKDLKVISQAVEGVDLVHVMMPFMLGKWSAKIAHSKGIPVTAGFHCQAENVTNHFFLQNSSIVNYAVYKDFYHKLYKFVDTVAYPSLFAKDLFERITKLGNGIVISNCVKEGFQVLENTEKPEQFKDKFVIFFNGRFSKEKCHIALVRAMKYSKYSDNIQLVFPGRGPLENKIKKEGSKLKNKPIITFFDPTDKNQFLELVKLYNYCDLYAHVSGVDIESLAVIEAICCGCCLLVSNSKKSSSRFFAIDDRNLFKHNNYKDLAKKIDYWVEHPKEREECGKKYALLKKQFTYEYCMSSMEEMILKTFHEKIVKNKTKKV